MKKKFSKEHQELGYPCEVKVLDIIKKEDPTAYIKEGYCKEFDIISPGLNLTFEIKNCNFSVKYIPIELKSDNAEAGINTTTADYWIIHCSNKFFKIKTEILKDLIKDIPVKDYFVKEQLKQLKLLDKAELIKNSVEIY